MAKTRGGMMDLEETGTGPSAPTLPTATPATDTGRPFCERHNCLMIANGTKEQVSYYRCPVPGCDCREKRARQTTPIPARPMTCPMPSCTQGEEKQYLAVDAERSNPAQLAMACPRCGNVIYAPRPTFADSFRPRGKAPAPMPGFDDR